MSTFAPSPTTAPSRTADAVILRDRIRSLRGLLLTAGLIALIAAWAMFVRPEGMGGATGYVFVSGNSMEPGLHTGDLVITRKHDTYRRGDVIAYRIPKGDVGAGAMVIHRIVGGSARSGYITLGDNRDAKDLWRPKPDDVIGKMVLDVAGAGRWISLVRQPPVIATLAALMMLFFWSPGGRGRRDDETPDASDAARGAGA